MRLNTKTIAKNAIIACAYAALTLMIAPIAYGEIQFRLSEVLVFLAFFNKKFNWGLIIGCFIANLTSPLGIYDIFFGTLSTVVVCMTMNYVKNLYHGAMFGSIITGVIVGFELSLAYGLPFILNAMYVGAGEALVLFIGALCFQWIQKNKRFIQMIQD